MKVTLVHSVIGCFPWTSSENDTQSNLPRQRAGEGKRLFCTKSKPGVYEAGLHTIYAKHCCAEVSSDIRLCGLSQLPHLLSGVGEQANHLPVERRNIIRFAARNQVLVADHFLVHPDRSRILQVGPQRWP